MKRCIVMKKQEKRKGRFKGILRKYRKFPTQKSYWQQAVTRKGKLACSIKAFGITTITGWIYYHSVWLVLLVSPLGIWIYHYFEQEKIEQKKSEFLLQFKEMTGCVASALHIGYSAENAFREAQKEMQSIYTEKSVMGTELNLIVRKIRLQIPLEQILLEFAQRVELEDVSNFSTVFAAAKRSGGDMISIIHNTADQIGEKIEVKREIDIILAAKKFEFRIMCVIPYAMILYMQLGFPEFMNVLYGNVIGIGVMTLCLAAYAGACMLGARLIRIDV